MISESSPPHPPVFSPPTPHSLGTVATVQLKRRYPPVRSPLTTPRYLRVESYMYQVIEDENGTHKKHILKHNSNIKK